MKQNIITIEGKSVTINGNNVWMTAWGNRRTVQCGNNGGKCGYPGNPGNGRTE